MTNGRYSVANFSTTPVKPLSLTGPATAPDGTAYVVTGPGGADHFGNSVVALGAGLQPKDWYTPTAPIAPIQYVDPVTFAYKGRQLVIAPGADNSVVVLDAAALGGADHHTPLAQSASFAKAGSQHGWDGFAVSQDKAGSTWIFASVSAPITNGGAHGGIVGFQLLDADGKLTLEQRWISKDMINPAKPSIANGVVVGLAGGDARTKAQLSVLDAATGTELFTSQDAISTYTSLSGIAIGDGHVFFTDHNGVLYSFGVGMEH